MLCPNTNSFHTRVPHRQHLHPFFLLLSPTRSLVHSRTPLSPTLAGICGFALLSLNISVAPHGHLKDVRRCQDLYPGKSPSFLLSPPPSKSPVTPHLPLYSFLTTSSSLLVPGHTMQSSCSALVSLWRLDGAPVRSDLFCLRKLVVLHLYAQGSFYRVLAVTDVHCSYYQPT